MAPGKRQRSGLREGVGLGKSVYLNLLPPQDSCHERLAQLTEQAVDKALRLSTASRRLVDVVDIQSCGETEELGCGIKSAFAFKLFKSSTKLAMSPGPSVQNCALGRKVQDRLIGARIYSLLMRWRPDPTFEWKARVALAVPILQEAFYRVANCTEEEHISRQHLELHLERVLLQFEAGNGLFLVRSIEPFYPSMRCVSELESSMNQTTTSFETSGDNASPSDIITDVPVGSKPFKSESRYEGNSPVKLDNSTPMQTPGRVANDMPVKKRAAANKTRSKCEPSLGALHSEENIANTYTRPHNKASAEMFRGDNEPYTHESMYQQNVIHARFSPRKTLGDMINLNWSNEQASGDYLITPSSSHLPSWSKNDTTTLPPNTEKQLSFSEGFCLPSSPSTAQILPALEASTPLTHLSPTASTVPLPSLLTSFSAMKNHHQMQQPWYSMYRQLLLGCETEVQASEAAATEVQAATRAALLSTSSLSSFSMTESMEEVSRERGAVRLPLSIFLAERDECKMKDMDKWAEPTEQMDPLCCVCMVGLKGAAFIPCGHTFCRKCSRELWRGRGACPLCNRFIREILDVY
ncbi:hypothetical protein GOP47_0016385 [Adiantum capillus-veneris]|uniref:RING-type domain-containing protein n=1 Tax=Adiantum capillus-veneris TaxID=13818 RepID=A0A9D4UHQ9_ADICA|nr:hypothetical protein GOP47_0016385 [Adiantum capillus-veneris]